MKKNILPFLFIAISFAISITTTAQNFGIGTTTPVAALEVSSTTNGFLPPRLTIAQRSAISNPATGLVIYCTDCYELEVYNGSIWKNMSGSVACLVAGSPYTKICSQQWVPNNLTVSKYRNGDIIPEVKDYTAWSLLTTGAWSWYNNDSATYAAVYGKMYNWYAVTDPRGLVPLGYHIPSDAEWATLSSCMGGDAVSGGKLKQTGYDDWLAPNTGATDSLQFAGLPSGSRSVTGAFNSIGVYGFYWTTTLDATIYAWSRYMHNSDGVLGRFNANKKSGFTVRYLKD